MNEAILRETSYSNCGQKAWAVEHKGRIMFYLIRGEGNEWTPREGLGRGYRTGHYDIPFGVKVVVAKKLETAKRKVFRALADALAVQSNKLLDQQVLLRRLAIPA